MIGSQLSQNFQIQDPYSIFQVPQQQEEPMDLDRRMKNLIQFENDFFQSVNRLEAQMSHLINTVKDRKTLPNTFSTIPDFPSHINGNKESWCLGDFNQEQFHHTNLNLPISDLGQIDKFSIQ